ncbi:MAG TPA: chemotaxis protein CheB [Pseudomonadales bacterium]|nr:chemotaxis protein CheB [Pseudomonadales bacterium]
MSSSGKQLAIISDKASCLGRLVETVRNMGYDVVLAESPETMNFSQSLPVDLWLLYLDEDRWADFVDQLIEFSDAPTLFGSTELPRHDSTELMRWNRHLLEKITKVLGKAPSQGQATLDVLQSINTLVVAANEAVVSEIPNDVPVLAPIATTAPAATGRYQQYNDELTRVWVLGASLGGPAAVKEFLDALPENLPVAFVLAQHIDKGFQKVLAQVLARHSHFVVSKESFGQRIEYGKVYIAPVEQVFDIEAGRIVPRNEQWQGPYAPSIDQVMQICSDYYGPHCSTILFSGMGSDGALYAPEQIKNGGKIWAQSADTCACSSMPDSARQTGCVSFSGTPKQLALQLVAQIRREQKDETQQQAHKLAF